MTAASISAIKDAVSLADIVGEYIKLRRVGQRSVGLCPFHKERTGSLSVNVDFFKCFGCGAGGDVFTFLSRIEGISPSAAIRLLSERTGIPLDGGKPTRIQRVYDRQEREFAEWWHAREHDRLTRRTSALNEYYAVLDEAEDGDVFWQAAEAVGVLSRRLAGLKRSEILAMALRAPASDRVEWKRELEWRKSWLALATAEPQPSVDAIQITGVALLDSGGVQCPI